MHSLTTARCLTCSKNNLINDSLQPLFASILIINILVTKSYVLQINLTEFVMNPRDQIYQIQMDGPAYNFASAK